MRWEIAQCIGATDMLDHSASHLYVYSSTRRFLYINSINAPFSSSHESSGRNFIPTTSVSPRNTVIANLLLESLVGSCRVHTHLLTQERLGDER